MTIVRINLNNIVEDFYINDIRNLQQFYLNFIKNNELENIIMNIRTEKENFTLSTLQSLYYISGGILPNKSK